MELISFEQLLKDAVEQPGKISEAYRYFHDYSTGNQLLAFWQCAMRGIEPGAINTYKGWLTLGRNVRKGEKAISLCMPVTCKTGKGKNAEQQTAPSEAASSDPNQKQGGFTRFIYRNNWFVMSQTEGAATAIPPVPEFEIETALAALDIQRVPFDLMNGNVQGFASDRTIAISPIAVMPLKTTFHEVAHVLLGHTAETMLRDSDATPRNIREVEAESVAMLCCASLGLDGVEFSRGYIQHWLAGNAIPEKSAQKIFKVANQILKAGRVERSANMELFA